jgi:intracellular sulfur oxidation DsrE/DsrF family protein
MTTERTDPFPVSQDDDGLAWRQSYKVQIAALQRDGVSMEECGMTMADKGWVNADMLPGVKNNTGANFRIVQPVQQGFVQLVLQGFVQIQP